MSKKEKKKIVKKIHWDMADVQELTNKYVHDLNVKDQMNYVIQRIIENINTL